MADNNTDTIVLVSGANKGIGKAVSIALARDHGYHVIIGSRRAEAGEALASELRSQGHKASSVQLDLASDESINNAVKTIEQTHGRLDALINNAGVLLDVLEPKMPTRELFERTFATNVTGPACLSAALVPLLQKARGGPRVVFVSTNMSCLTNATDKSMLYYNIDYTAYDCSKTATNMLALNYVRILDSVGGRVNIVCPGLVKTDLTRFHPYGTSVEEGAERIVQVITTTGDDAPNGTFSNKYGPLPW